MARSEIKFVVYPPPSEGLPHLAVAISADGKEIIAKPFPSAMEAEAYKRDHAGWTAEQPREKR